MVVAIQTVPLRLYKWVIECICSRSHICLKRSVSWLGHQPYNSAGIASAPGDLLLESPEIAFTTLASVGGFSRAALIGTLGRRAMASFIVDVGWTVENDIKVFSPTAENLVLVSDD